MDKRRGVAPAPKGTQDPATKPKEDPNISQPKEEPKTQPEKEPKLTQPNEEPKTPKQKVVPITPKPKEDPKTPKLKEGPKTPKLKEDPETLKLKENPETPKPKEDPETPKPKEGPSTPKPKEDSKAPKPKEEPKISIPKEDPKSPKLKPSTPKVVPKVPKPKEEPKVPRAKEEPTVPKPKEEPKLPKPKGGTKKLKPKENPASSPGKEDVMPPQNGQSNGDSHAPNSTWVVGLVNAHLKYLTAETFGFKVNANGLALKKKQMWTLEAFGDNTDAVSLKSHLDKYLSVDQFGNVTCDSDEKDNGARFEIVVPESGAGKWAFRHPGRGYFLGAAADKLVCTAKTPTENELWFVHLAARPQVNLRSLGRRRFAHLSEQGDEIHVDSNIPWGSMTLFTLEFRDDSRLYAIHTANNRYLSREGKLLEQCGQNCLFSLEYHAGALALRDTQGLYLAPLGSKAVLRTRSTSVTKDELFTLEDSLAQAVFVAMMNGRYVSVKQGVDVTANQEEISDHETFQLEYDAGTGRWYIRTMGDCYWTLQTTGGIQASQAKKSSNALFQLEWLEDGSVGFRANNGKFVATKKSGHLYANTEAPEETSKFFFYLINRQMLVLKSEQGFVGYKSGTSCKLECNKANYEAIQVERGPDGLVYFKGQNGRYWHVTGDGIAADSDTPEGFYLELREPSKLCIKTNTGAYLMADKNGAFLAGSREHEKATLWEF